MAEISTRQDRKRELIESINPGESRTTHLYPKELEHLKAQYPDYNFEIVGIKEGRCKICLVKISL